MRTRRLTLVALAILAGVPPLGAQERQARPRPPAPVPEPVPHVQAAPHAEAPAVPEHALPHAPAVPHVHALEPALPHAPLAPAPPAVAAEADGFQDLDLAAPEPWALQDPADSLYRAARRALNDGAYAEAARLFGRLHTEARYRGSEYRALAYYYEALARTQVGGRDELGRARAVLEAMRAQHAAAWRDQRDAAALLTRIDAELARLGNATAARNVLEHAQAAARSGCTDANMGTRIEAMNALLQMDAAAAMPILAEVMKNRSTDACAVELRRRAVFLVSQKRTEQSADLLLDAARNDPDPQVQEQAVFWLSQVGGEQAVAALESILRNSTSEKLQERAVFALSQHRSARAVELLRDFALRTDVPAELRGNAIFWIGQHASSENARFIRELYPRLREREIKEKALFAVSQARGDDNAEWLLGRALDQNEDPEIRKNALFWAGQQRTLPIARLGELYDRMPSDELKGQVVFALSQRAREPEAVDLLIRIARNEKNPEVRKQAIFWLGQSRDPRAAAFLLELIKG